MHAEHSTKDVGAFDTSLVCLNGHIITRALHKNPWKQEKFCSKCGAGTVSACEKCKTEIRGESRSGRTFAPALRYFCHECGAAYPWVSLRIEAAKAIVHDQQKLTPKERMDLAVSLDELVKDSPMTPASVSRFKVLVKKAGPAAAIALKELLFKIAVEAAKKGIWG